MGAAKENKKIIKISEKDIIEEKNPNPDKEERNYSICDKCKLACATGSCHRCLKRRGSLLKWQSV